MAKFTSRFPELTFYVGNEAKRFTNGAYETDDKAVIGVLDTLTDIVKVDEPKAVKAEEKPAEKPKPAAKAKPSGK